jgi:hypothetical protein
MAILSPSQSIASYTKIDTGSNAAGKARAFDDIIAVFAGIDDDLAHAEPPTTKVYYEFQ